MNESPLPKIICAVAYACFAGISCWATAESLHLLLSTLPLAVCWIISIGLFLIASYGTKLMADSANTDIYMERRGAKFFCGMGILLAFWLVCSMPTNTHTFFYRNTIAERVADDIASTQGYLVQIKDNVVTETKINLQRPKPNHSNHS